MDIGCVRMTERHLHDDPPTAAQIAAAEAGHHGRGRHGAGGRAGPRGRRRWSGLAGTVTTVAALALGLPEYDAGPHPPRPGLATTRWPR